MIMDYKCPVCGKSYCSLDYFSKHMVEENEKAKKEEADATLKRLNELEKKIREVYNLLKQNADEYNKLSDNTKCNISMSFRKTNTNTYYMNEDEAVKRWVDALFGGAED